MSNKKTNVVDVDDKHPVWGIVQNIHDMVKIRHTLSYGTSTGVRKDAESTMSRAISSRVDDLARLILQTFKD